MDAMNGVKWLLCAMLAALPAWACTTIACKPSIEMNERFTVEILADGKPVPGAEVRVTGPGGPRVIQTSAEGRAVFGPLAKGNYQVVVTKLGLEIKSDCFRVSRQKDKGRRELKYTWGEYAISVVRLAGRIAPMPPMEVPKPNPSRIELPPVQHAIAVLPVSKLTVEDLDGQLRTASIDNEGKFDFGDLPDALYVMRGERNRPFLVKVDRRASWQRLEFWGNGFDLCDSYVPEVRAFTSLP